MATRKVRLGKKIDRDILKTLEQSGQPMSTRDLALRINRAWHSVQNHCLRLQLEKRLHGFRISNLNVWESRKREVKEKHSETA